MTTQEFSDSFDILVNSFARNMAFGTDNNDIAFNEYEKSVFLTKAQEQIVISLYNGKNSNGTSFESSEEVRRYLEPLVVGKIEETPDTTTVDAQVTSPIRSARDTYMVVLPHDLWFIIFESVDLELPKACQPNLDIQVQPITHDEYHKIKKNPFRGANDHRVLRLDSNLYNDNYQYVELVSKYPIKNYIFRYLRKPRPIILVDLDTEGLSINSSTKAQTSELNEALHDRILELAVQLGLQSKGINNNNS